ncbi:MAG: hypothetical protein H0V30_10605 [Chitinophagaceae bacterium]|nr:hypothetical protein [Chitinophagaceae bacterium]
MQSPLIFYSERLDIVRKELDKIVGKRRWVTASRFLFFFSAIILLILYFRGNIDHYLPAITFLLCFLIVVRIDVNLLTKKNFISKQLFSIENEIGVLQNQENQFNNGSVFASEENYTDDLDVFGRYSIFHLLNRCSTHHGLQLLADRFKQPYIQKTAIENYQHAVKVFSTQPIIREHVTAAGLVSGENAGTLNDVSGWMQSEQIFEGKMMTRILRFLLPVINFATAYYWLSEGNYFPFILSVVLTWIYLGSSSAYIHKQHDLIGKKNEILNQYAGILFQFSPIDPGASTYLMHLRKQSLEAYEEIKRLSKLSELFDQRLNMLVFIILNTFFLYDIQVTILLEKWKSKNKHAFPGWLQSVADIEYLISLSAFAFNNPGFSFPQLSENSKTIQAVQLSHPLIEPAERVYNNFALGENEKLMLITGSNMSGKSTFLRSIGINVLLAQCGAPVCAQSFKWMPVRLLTCIRVTDSLHDHTSYFMAELKKLQLIIHALREDVFSLVLIDEILRGTNSDDKHHGSQKYIEQLISFPCLSLFATHDIQLGQMEQSYPGLVGNYCFESMIQDNEIYFDYKLHKGVSKNRNASFLMKKMEII